VSGVAGVGDNVARRHRRGGALGRQYRNSQRLGLEVHAPAAVAARVRHIEPLLNDTDDVDLRFKRPPNVHIVVLPPPRSRPT